MNIENVEVLAVGVWNRQEFTVRDLDAIVQSFDELQLSGRVPVKLGHSMDDTLPAQGWVTELHREGDRLLATLDQVPDALVDEIKAGRWRHVSVELMKDVARGDKRYAWALDGLAVLGSARPAVDVLKGLHEVVMSSLAGWRFGSRVSFSRRLEANDDMNEVERLQSENARLTAALINSKFEHAIATNRIQPSERSRFVQKFGRSATLSDCEQWIQSAPKPKNSGGGTIGGGGMGDGDGGELAADAQLVQLVREYRADFLEKHDREIPYHEAAERVCRDPKNRDLVERYTRLEHFPGYNPK